MHTKVEYTDGSENTRVMFVSAIRNNGFVMLASRKHGDPCTAWIAPEKVQVSVDAATKCPDAAAATKCQAAACDNGWKWFEADWDNGWKWFEADWTWRGQQHRSWSWYDNADTFESPQKKQRYTQQGWRRVVIKGGDHDHLRELMLQFGSIQSICFRDDVCRVTFDAASSAERALQEYHLNGDGDISYDRA